MLHEVPAAERQAQESFRIAAESVSAPVARCSRDLRYLWVSKPYADWLGRTVEETVGRPIVDVIGADAFVSIRPYWVSAVISGSSLDPDAQSVGDIKALIG